jgi:Domain of unknown function (DUF4129)
MVSLLLAVLGLAALVTPDAVEADHRVPRNPPPRPSPTRGGEGVSRAWVPRGGSLGATLPVPSPLRGGGLGGGTALGTGMTGSSDRPANVRTVLEHEGYPWYDAKAERVKPILSSPDFGGGFWKSWGDRFSRWFEPIRNLFRWLNGWRVPWVGGVGDIIAGGLALLLLTVVLVVVLELLRRYRRATDEPASADAATIAGQAPRIEGLPASERLSLADPLAEAKRLRARGDYAAAVIHLFAHQILTLARIGQLRVVPGRTARQLVRAVGHRGLRSTVEPTLRLFEAVYYGHHVPSAAAFEAAWSQVEVFDRHVDALAAGRASS